MRHDSSWAINNNYNIASMFRGAKPCTDAQIKQFRKRSVDIADHKTWGFHGCLETEARKIITIALDRQYDPAHQIGLINLATAWVRSVGDGDRLSGNW